MIKILYISTDGVNLLLVTNTNEYMRIVQPSPYPNYWIQDY